MGSWSVYCGISQISITSGQECVFIPLRKRDYTSGGVYDPFIPATLPIFGEYNDYGGIENIIRDENVEMIEQYFGCKIEEFCDFLTDGRKDYNDTYSDWHGKEHLKPLESYTYMWVDRKVWDFMRNHHPRSYGRSGDFDMGNPTILKALGFEYVGKTKDKRYTDHYRYEKNGVVVNIKSDGTWAHYLNGDLVYNMGDLKEKGVDVSYFENKEEHNFHELFDYKWKIRKLGWVIGFDHNFVDRFDTSIKDILESLTNQELRNKIEAERLESTKEFNAWFRETMKKNGRDVADDYNISKPEPIYIGEIIAAKLSESKFFADGLADMLTVKLNMHPGSMTWAPYIQFLTPQCGEYKEHQAILEAFAKINKEIMAENGYDEEEDE